MQLLITRPQDQALKTAAALKKLGHTPFMCPLLQIVPLPLICFLPLTTPVIITSHNALWALKGRSPQHLYCVGETLYKKLKISFPTTPITQTATARELQALLPLNSHPLLFLRGWHVTISFDDSGGNVHQAVVYEAMPLAQLPLPIIKALKRSEIQGVLFYSKRTAQIFKELILNEKLVHTLQKICFYGLTSSCVSPLEDLPHASLQVPPVPNQRSLLTLLS